jgi:hypothetical protein
MTLLSDICRGIWESLRETLPGDAEEAKCFLGGFWMALAVQLVWFTALSLGTAYGQGGR